MALKNKRILVTGCEGYIGGHTCMALKDSGYEVVALDNVSSRNMWRHDLYDTSIISDINYLNVEWLDFAGIVHLAGTSLVGPSIETPALYYHNNVGGTAKLLLWLASHGFKGTFVFSSSASVYGNVDTDLISENYTTNPINPYGQSKLMAEKVIEDSAKAYGMTAVSLRYFNACGADLHGRFGQMPNTTHIIAKLAESVLNNRPFVIYGNDYPTDDGTCVRDYLHVSDIAEAHILALESASAPYNVYNLGTGTGHSILELISVFEQVTNTKINMQHGVRRNGDPARLVADSSRFSADFNWRPNYSSLETIISTAWQWYNSDRYRYFAAMPRH